MKPQLFYYTLGMSRMYVLGYQESIQATLAFFICDNKEICAKMYIFPFKQCIYKY